MGDLACLGVPMLVVFILVLGLFEPKEKRKHPRN